MKYFKYILSMTGLFYFLSINAQEVDKKLLIELVNEIRDTGLLCGDTECPSVPEVKWSDVLEKAALMHADDMNKNNYFNHSSPDGNSTMVSRVKKVGYDYSYIAENIAWGQTSESDVILSWKNSPGHCKNMLNGKVKEFAVARVGEYWVMVLGKSIDANNED